MGDPLLFWIQVVEHHICVGGTAGSEDDDFSYFRQFLQELLAERADSHSSLCFIRFTAREPPLYSGKFNLTVQLLECSSQWIRVSSRSRNTVVLNWFFLGSLSYFLGLATLKVLDVRSTSMHWQKCCLQRFIKQVVSCFLRQRCRLPMQQVLLKFQKVDFDLSIVFWLRATSSGLFLSLMEGSLKRSLLLASGKRLVLAISSVLVLILSREKEGLDLIFSGGSRLQLGSLGGTLWGQVVQLSSPSSRLQLLSLFFLLRRGVQNFYLFINYLQAI